MDERRICMIGLGGGGTKIAGRIVGLASSGLSMAVVNTDTLSLGDSNAPRKIQVGQTRTGGMGAGGDLEIGRLAVEDEIERIIPLFRDAELLLLVVTLGGGTGGGGAPIVLEAAREAGCLTLCFATLPFSFEGEDRQARATSALEPLRAAADAVIAVSNDRLFDSVRQPNLTEAFTKADEVLGAGIRSVWRLLTQAGYIHLDFADLSSFVRTCGGICSLACGSGRGQDKAANAVSELLQSPLTAESELLRTARSVLVSIVGGPDLTLKEIGDIMQSLTAQLQAQCHVVMGTVVDDAWRNNLMITVLFADQWRPEEAKPKKLPDREKKPDAVAPGKRGGRGRSAANGGKTAKGTQTSLSFEAAAKGRFKGVEPTMLGGEDFDIPTFQRRGISIEKE